MLEWPRLSAASAWPCVYVYVCARVRQQGPFSLNKLSHEQKCAHRRCLRKLQGALLFALAWRIIAAAARISQDLLGIRICFGALSCYGGWTCVSLAGMRELVLCLRRARCYYTPRAAAAEDVQIFVSQQIGTGFHALNFKAGRRLLDIIWPNWDKMGNNRWLGKKTKVGVHASYKPAAHSKFAFICIFCLWECANMGIRSLHGKNLYGTMVFCG